MRCLLPTIVGLAICSSVHAQTYTLLTQTRTLYSEYHHNGQVDIDSAQAPDAGPFDDAVGSVGAGASQDSHFESLSLIGSGTARSGGCAGGSPGACVSGTGSSIFDATFNVAHPTRFKLVSSFYAPAPGCVGTMSFSGPSGVIVAHDHTGNDNLSG